MSAWDEMAQLVREYAGDDYEVREAWIEVQDEVNSLRSRLAAAEADAQKYQEWLANAEGRCGMFEARLALAESALATSEQAREEAMAALIQATERLSIMGCGHPQCMVVSSSEGTSYCEMCRLEAKAERVKELEGALRQIAENTGSKKVYRLARRALGLEVEP